MHIEKILQTFEQNLLGCFRNSSWQKPKGIHTITLDIAETVLATFARITPVKKLCAAC